MNTVIEFKDIKSAYGQQTIVEHFNLTIERGQFCDDYRQLWLRQDDYPKK